MLKVLVSNANANQNLAYCKFLSNDKDLKVQSTKDEIETLKKYFDIEPDIFILDSHFQNMNYAEIIDRISTKPNEMQKCNTLVTINKLEDKLCLQNVAKIYKIFLKPLDMTLLSNTIKTIGEEKASEDITLEEIQALLISLRFNITSRGTKYIITAILQNYYYTSLFPKLDNLFEAIAYQYNVTPDSVREAIRGALIPLNRYRYAEYQ